MSATETLTLTPFEQDAIRVHLDRAIVFLSPLVVEGIEEAGALRSELCLALESVLSFSGHIGFGLRSESLVLEDGGAELCAVFTTKALRNRADLEQGEVDVWLNIAARLPQGLRDLGGEVDRLIDDLEVK